MTSPGHLLRERPCRVWFCGFVDRKTQGSGAATPKEELLGDRDLTWHARGEASARQMDRSKRPESSSISPAGSRSPQGTLRFFFVAINNEL